MIKIATILTCFNRKAKTVRCLTNLFRVLDLYNANHSDRSIVLSVYLTDDASSDGTAEAAKDVCKDVDFNLCQGDGKCFWAGGMRLAWREALKRHEEWDFYLLLNDDTTVMDNVFEQLMVCHEYALDKFGKAGVYSGCTCDEDNTAVVTYSGDVINPKTKGWDRLMPNGTPQIVDMTNANILLVDKSVVDDIGIFNEGYIHGVADQDYGMTARRAGFPVLITSVVCGYCELDHLSEQAACKELMKMSFKERREYVYRPIHSDSDYLLFIKRNMPKRFYVSWVLRKIRLYFPNLYYKICVYRGIYR